MIFPSVDKLEDKADSRYTLVILAARRAKQLKEGAPKLIETKSNNPLTIALEEIAAGKITYSVPSHDESISSQPDRDRAEAMAEAAQQILPPAEVIAEDQTAVIDVEAQSVEVVEAVDESTTAEAVAETPALEKPAVETIDEEAQAPAAEAEALLEPTQAAESEAQETVAETPVKAEPKRKRTVKKKSEETAGAEAASAEQSEAEAPPEKKKPTGKKTTKKNKDSE